MLDNYVIINKKILPEIYLKVLEAKQLVNNDKISISDAVKKIGIARSTYYKYKDNIFSTDKNKTEIKAVISFILSHKKGLLSSVLNFINSHGGNIITINQNIPIDLKASVTISLDISELNINIDDFILYLSELEGISGVNLVSLE